MQTKSKILEDAAKLGLGSLGLFKGVKAEIKRGLRAKVETADQNSGLVLREEFRIFSKIVQKQQLKIDELEARLTKFEQNIME